MQKIVTWWRHGLAWAKFEDKPFEEKGKTLDEAIGLLISKHQDMFELSIEHQMIEVPFFTKMELHEQ